MRLFFFANKKRTYCNKILTNPKVYIKKADKASISKYLSWEIKNLEVSFVR